MNNPGLEEILQQLNKIERQTLIMTKEILILRPLATAATETALTGRITAELVVAVGKYAQFLKEIYGEEEKEGH